MFCAKYLFPEGYNFGEEERFVFNLGVMAGSRCSTDLSKVNFNNYLNKPLNAINKELDINKDILLSCYDLEINLFLSSEESQRLKYHELFL